MCVDAVLEDADAAGFDRFVLVGHSLGGLTITETANRAPERVAHLVYLAAFAPSPGACLFDVSPRYDGVPDGVDPAGVQPAPSQDSAHRLFAGDLDATAFADVNAKFVPERIGLFLATVTGYPADVPSTYVRCMRDVTVPPASADGMIANLRPGAIVDLDSDHDPMLSHPKELAALINEIAAERKEQR